MKTKEVHNVKFAYLYRDAGNYKQWAQVIFSNPENLSLTEIDKSLRQAFLEDGLFIARQIRIPEVFPFNWGAATSDDHCFHEFDKVAFTRQSPSDPFLRSIGRLTAEVNQASRAGWVRFDPHEALVRQR